MGLLYRQGDPSVAAAIDAEEARFDAAGSGGSRRPQVVILGAGFAGLNAATGLRRAEADVTVVDRRNYHLFQPLLYQVATAGLSPAQIATPIRAVLSRQRNATVLMDRVVDIDVANRKVITERHRTPYDCLIVATGARHAYFGHDEWERYAPGLKKIDDATDLRRRILGAFEQAETCHCEDTRKAMMTFVVVGAGPTGVEMAGAIAELARNALARDFRRIDPTMARVVLIEAGSRVLPSFPESLSASARRQLEALGVAVMTDSPVMSCDGRGVTLADGTVVEAATLVWAAGVVASSAANWLKAKCDRAGRVIVNPDLTLPGHPEIFVLGDTASVPGDDDRPVPGVAPAAKQMGRHAARTILARLAGRPEPGQFRYRDFGNLATIGRKAAVADFGGLRLSGFPAWLVWSLAHVYFLIGFRNRLVVSLDWLWSYFSFHRGARLITGEDNRTCS